MSSQTISLLIEHADLPSTVGAPSTLPFDDFEPVKTIRPSYTRPGLRPLSRNGDGQPSSWASQRPLSENTLQQSLSRGDSLDAIGYLAGDATHDGTPIAPPLRSIVPGNHGISDHIHRDPSDGKNTHPVLIEGPRPSGALESLNTHPGSGVHAVDIIEPLNARPVLQSVWEPHMNRYRFASASLGCFASGLFDSAPGALLQFIERDYDIGYAVVSLIFVAQALGFIGSATFVNTLTQRLGRGKVLLIANCVLILAYVVLVLHPPFGAVVFAFFLSGLGTAMVMAICQVFVANLQRGTVMSGIYQGCYGIGGTIGPLIATTLASHGIQWSHFYYMSLGLATCTLVSQTWSFWTYESEQGNSHDDIQHLSTSHHHTQHRRPSTAANSSRLARLKRVVVNKPTLIGASFIFFYQGAEVAISGWVTSFLISYRGGDPSHVGYVTSGFWAGITIGRFLLSHLGAVIGERAFIFLLTAGATVLQLLIWLVPSVIGDAIAVSLAGLLLGPIYPGATSVLMRLIPKHLQVPSYGIVAGVGSSGGAFVPFCVGLLAQRVGTAVLHPVCIGAFVVMAALWGWLPRVGRRDE